MMGSMKVKIEGLNSGKIINSLIENGVFLKDLKEKKHYVTFELELGKEEILKKVCKRYHKKYEIISKNCFVNSLLKLRYCLGSVLAFVIIFALIFSFNAYVYEVNLTASTKESFDLSNIEQILKDNGVYVGAKKNDIDYKDLENKIVSSQQNVAGCSVKKNGGKIDIIIYPGTVKQNVSKENIYSNFDGVITSVEIYSGNSNLKEGDIVRKGDLLIENDNGASGKIIAKVFTSDYLIFNENQVSKVKTGNIKENKQILIFGKKLSKAKQNHYFSNYFEENCVFSISKNMFLPISILKTTYEEFELKEQFVAFESVEESLRKELINNIVNKNNLSLDNAKVTYSIFRENNLVRLDCFVEREVDLAKH